MGAIMSKQIVPFSGKLPSIDLGVFLAPGARLVGDVKIEQGSSVYYNAVIRGDLAPVRIGARTNIQDNATIHVSAKCGVTIGDEVTVGHNAILHGCTVESGCTIGMGSIVMDGARIRKNSIVGAGALVTAGKDFPEGSLILGSPATFIRELTEEELRISHENTINYANLVHGLDG